MHFAEHYLTAFFIFLIIDSIWLGWLAKDFYKDQLGHLLAKKPNLKAAAVFYPLYILGIVFFVVDPALVKNSLSYAVGAGALLGLVMYATYDLTNLSTLKKWPISVTIVDMLWGTFITCTVATMTYGIFAQ